VPKRNKHVGVPVCQLHYGVQARVPECLGLPGCRSKRNFAEPVAYYRTGFFLAVSSKGVKQISEGELMKEIEEFIQGLFHPPKRSGFTVVIMSETSFLYHCYSENRAVASRLGVLQAKSCLEGGRPGLKVYIYDHFTEIIDEIDFIKFY
jgi:hypothetical protein